MSHQRTDRDPFAVIDTLLGVRIIEAATTAAAAATQSYVIGLFGLEEDIWGLISGNTPGESQMQIATCLRLSNEFLVTYYIDNVIYDKKYVFLPDSIQEKHFSSIPILNKKGVLIK